MSAIIIMTTYPNNGRKLKKLIFALLKQNLAKQIQRLNYMKSYFMQEEKFIKKEEKLLLIKTTEDKKEKCINFLKRTHPYETPEIITIKPDKVNEDYLKWLNK